jgi:hypothetical protein
VIDAAHVVEGMQGIPAARFIRVHDGAERDAILDRGNRVALFAEHERQRAAVALAHHDHDLALAGLFLGKASINALGRFILGFDVASEVGTIDLTLSGDLSLALYYVPTLKQCSYSRMSIWF